MYVSYPKIKEHLEGKYDLEFLRFYGCQDVNPSTEEFKKRAIKQQGFYRKLTKLGLDIFIKPLQDIDGKIKGDLDNDIQIAIKQHLDIKDIECIVLFSGDKHFLPVIKECHKAGKYVDVYSFKQVLSDGIKVFALENPKCKCIYLNKKRAELELK